MMDAWLIVTFIYIIAIVGHELAHATTAISLGYKLKKIYFGIPLEIPIGKSKYSIHLFRKEYKGVEYGISPLLLGGAVDFHGLEDAPLRQFNLIVAYGPIYNLIAGFAPLLIYFSFSRSIEITAYIIQISWKAILDFIVAGAPIYQIPGPVSSIGLMGEIASGHQNGYLLVWVVLNFALFATNILPIPAIDGGHILSSAVITVFGKKVKPLIKIVNVISWYVLIVLMTIVMTKDLW